MWDGPHVIAGNDLNNALHGGFLKTSKSYTFRFRPSTTRLLGLWLVRKEERCPMDDDSAQWLASESGLPRTSRLRRAKIRIEIELHFEKILQI